jgi:hypothetical protein
MLGPGIGGIFIKHGIGGRGAMSDSPHAGTEADRGSDAQRIPMMQRLLDNPFALLFLGVTIPTVFYIIWGLIELTQIPIAQ